MLSWNVVNNTLLLTFIISPSSPIVIDALPQIFAPVSKPARNRSRAAFLFLSDISITFQTALRIASVPRNFSQSKYLKRAFGGLDFDFAVHCAARGTRRLNI
jgi:hypothetical protein